MFAQGQLVARNAELYGAMGTVSDHMFICQYFPQIQKLAGHNELYIQLIVISHQMVVVKHYIH